MRLKASSYFLIGGDADDLIQEGLVGLYKAVRDYRCGPRVELPQLRRALHHAPDHHRGQDLDAQQAHPAERVRVVLADAGGGRGRRRSDPRRAAAGPDGARSGEPGDLHRGAAQPRGVPVERALGARELGALALPGRLQLRGHRRAARLRHEDGGQRPPARQAQGRGAPRLARRCCSRHLVSGQTSTRAHASAAARTRRPTHDLCGYVPPFSCPRPLWPRWRSPSSRRRRQTTRPSALRRRRCCIVLLQDHGSPAGSWPPAAPARARIGSRSCVTGVALAATPGGPRAIQVGAETEFGSRRVLAVAAQRGDWLGLVTSERPNNELAWVRRGNRSLTLRSTSFSLHVDLSAHTLTLRRGGRRVHRMSVAVGRRARTPRPAASR